MNAVDYVIIVILVISTLLGLKKGVIKSLVQLVGTVAIVILSYVFKGYLANYLMSFMPFLNFPGFEGITAINILMYEMISFIVIFILFYCVLNILLTLSGLIETLLKITVVLAIPSKILGAIVGFLEGVVLAFLITFCLFHLGFTQNYVAESKFGVVLLERTPFMGQVMAKTTLALESIHDVVSKIEKEEDRPAANARVLQELIHYQIITKEDAKRIIEEKNLEDLKNVSFA